MARYLSLPDPMLIHASIILIYYCQWDNLLKARDASSACAWPIMNYLLAQRSRARRAPVTLRKVDQARADLCAIADDLREAPYMLTSDITSSVGR